MLIDAIKMLIGECKAQGQEEAEIKSTIMKFDRKAKWQLWRQLRKDGVRIRTRVAVMGEAEKQLEVVRGDDLDEIIAEA